MDIKNQRPQTPQITPVSQQSTPVVSKVDTTPLTPPKPAKQPKNDGLKGLISTIAVLLLAPIIALFLTAFVFQSYQVDGSSMETTLQNNDRLIVWKLGRTWARVTHSTYLPNRGDIVIFHEESVLAGKQLIKRVIGLPGDRVVVADGKITVFNKEHPNGFNPDTTLPYSKQTSIPETNGSVDVVVPAGQVFVCGDNRGNSQDSRAFGPVPTKDIVGKLVLRVIPVSKMERF